MAECVRGCAWTDDLGHQWGSDATHGVLCDWCFQRLDDHLRMAPFVVELLRELVVPTLQAAKLGDKVSGTRESDVPFRAGDAALADEITERVTGWAMEFHRLTGINAPDAIRARVAADVSAAGTGVVGGREARELVDVYSSWLRRHLESLAYQELVVLAHDEVVPVVRKAVRRLGVRPVRPKRSTGRCPVCATLTVEVLWVGGSARVPTGRVECSFCGWASERWSPVSWAA